MTDLEITNIALRLIDAHEQELLRRNNEETEEISCKMSFQKPWICCSFYFIKKENHTGVPGWLSQLSV